MLGSGPHGPIGGDRKRKLMQQQPPPMHQQQQQQQMPMQRGAAGINNGQAQHPMHMMQHPQHPQQHQHMAMPAIGAGPPIAGSGGGGGGAGNSGAPTCVVFVGEIPPNTCELDLKRAFQEFGKLEQIVTFPAKGQALVEFLRPADAERVVAMCQSGGCSIAVNGGNLAVSFSNLPRIDMSQESYQSAMPQNCLLLTFYNVRLDFSCDSIRQICSPYGLVDRCLLIRQQDGLLRAVVEFAKLEDAVLTKPNINGANMYANCNSVRCEYARHTAFEYFASRETVLEEYRYDLQQQQQMSMPADAGMLGPAKRARMPPQPLQHQQPPPPPPPSSVMGSGGLLMMPQQRLQQQVAAALPPSQLQQQQQQQQQHHHQKSQRGQGGPPLARPDHSVIVVRGLSPQMNCDRLFNVLCLYGNVGFIKFLTNKEGFALVEMMDVTSAQQAVDFLHGQQVLGSSLKVTHSDQGMVKRGFKDFCLADGSPAEKSFDAAKLNRFMSQGAVLKNQASLGRTGRVLYYWGCPDGTPEEQIRKALKMAGASDPVEVATQNEKRTTGWITFANVGDATDAICLANHAVIGETGKLKLSFAVKK